MCIFSGVFVAWNSAPLLVLACLVAQLCRTLCDPMDCSLPGSSVHGSFQAWIQVWGAISFSRVSSQPRDQTLVSCWSCFAGGFFTYRATGASRLSAGLFPTIYQHTCLPCYKQKEKQNSPQTKQNKTTYPPYILHYPLSPVLLLWTFLKKSLQCLISSLPARCSVCLSKFRASHSTGPSVERVLCTIK